MIPRIRSDLVPVAIWLDVRGLIRLGHGTVLKQFDGSGFINNYCYSIIYLFPYASHTWNMTRPSGIQRTFDDTTSVCSENWIIACTGTEKQKGHGYLIPQKNLRGSENRSIRHVTCRTCDMSDVCDMSHVKHVMWHVGQPFSLYSSLHTFCFCWHSLDSIRHQFQCRLLNCQTRVVTNLTANMEIGRSCTL